MANKLYFKEDLYIPICSIAASELIYGVLFYVFRFLLRGRLDFPYYLGHIIIPEIIYTTLVGIVLFRIMYQLEEKINPEEEVSLEERSGK